MSPRTRSGREAAQNYFISFTDLLVGILFIFILMLMTYALSTKAAQRQLEEKRNELSVQVERLNGRFEMRTALLKAIVSEASRRGVDSRFLAPDYAQGVLRFNSDQFFETRQSALKQEAVKPLSIVAQVMAEKIPCFIGSGKCSEGAQILEAVYVEGHTDKRPYLTGNIDRNWELSSERARSTYDHLLRSAPALGAMKNSAGEQLLSLSAYGSTRPISSLDSRNRRIDIRFLLAAPTVDEVKAAAR